ncbi:nuclear transport factor 2 family protein [Amycolatopsis sp. NBC_00345]|uniref:nuclear transport factor 2 family protein n=1 Tax=Amycolatopsis sp. NBC_00345 TaxID=2975955 RepID=UPI002E269575
MIITGVTLAALPASAALPAPVVVPATQPGGTTTAKPGSGPRPDHRPPRVVEQWASAWNTGDALAMSALFAPDGTYTDHAFQAAFTGPAGVEQWVTTTMQRFRAFRATVENAFRLGDNIAVTWTFAGTFGDRTPFTPPHDPAGKSFSVPATSVFTLRHDRIVSAEDYYNLADVLRQVGLPAGPFTPPGAN